MFVRTFSGLITDNGFCLLSSFSKGILWMPPIDEIRETSPRRPARGQTEAKLQLLCSNANDLPSFCVYQESRLSPGITLDHHDLSQVLFNCRMTIEVRASYNFAKLLNLHFYSQWIPQTATIKGIRMISSGPTLQYAPLIKRTAPLQSSPER